MNDLFRPDSDTNGPEPLDEGGTWLLDLVSAVDHLRRGYRPGFTVWDALAEAVEWSTATIADDGPPAEEVGSARMSRRADYEAMQRAVRVWILVMADRYNSGHHWPHPTGRRAFPPTQLTSR